MRAAQKNDVIKFLDDWAKLTERQKVNFVLRQFKEEVDLVIFVFDSIADAPNTLNKHLQEMLDSEAALESAKVDRACGVKV